MSDISDIQNIIENVNCDFAVKTKVRDKTLYRSRELVSHCARAIQATHRGKVEEAETLLTAAQSIAAEMVKEAQQFSDVYYAGYTQDGLKEYAEARLTQALVLGQPIPTPQDLKVENAAYINGLAEAVGELRRHALDALRNGDIAQAERVLDLMDEIYMGLLTVDFPSAITGGLRRKRDMVRGVTERTRGDVTTAARQEAMKAALAQFEARVEGNEK